MARGLKCPRCKSQSAYKQWDFNERLGRHFRNKHCPSCGYQTPNHYYGGVMTLEECQEEIARIRAEIVARLAEKEA